MLNCLVILNKYRLSPERLYEPFRRNSTKSRTAGHLVLKDPCPAAGHLDAAIKNCSLILFSIKVSYVQGARM